MKKSPLVSVLVHTKNSNRTILHHLQSIKNQSYKNIEIIVVDNNSTDDTKEIARQFTKQIYNFGPERSAQRNFAAKKAKGDYCLIPDSDMILSEDVIADCVDLISKDSNIKSIIIPEKTTGKGFWAKCKTLERDCYLKEKNIEAARFFEKKAFQDVGGYDESITGPEDWDLSQRIKSKYKTGRINSYILHDEGEVKLLGLIKKKYYYGKKLSFYLKKHPIKLTGSQMIYFFRPAFYRNWKKLINNPLVTCGTIIMLTAEQAAGFFGFVLSNQKEKEN